MLKKIHDFIKNNILSEGSNQQKVMNLPLATCAILMEIARADGNYTPEENKLIVATLEKKFHLPPEKIKDLLVLTEAELTESIDLWQFTHYLNNHLNREEKILLLEAVWEIVYADKFLDKHEDHLIHRIQELLHLTHRDLINTKVKIKEKKK